MAFFKFRKDGDEHPAPTPAPESVEALRRRARHRLIGAAVLVLLGVIGFPLLFDNQPRPVAVDIPIDIPDRNKVKPLGNAPAPVAQASGAVSAPVAATPTAPASAASVSPAPVAVAPATRAATGVVSSVAPAAKPAPVEAPKPAPKAETILTEKAPAKPADKVPAKTDDGAKAKALLDGKDVAKPAAAAAATGRFVVQVGAYGEVLKAREARMKLERAGLKTYTQVVQSAEGKRIRVRVGPFENKAEADKVAEKIKKLDLPAAILEL